MLGTFGSDHGFEADPEPDPLQTGNHLSPEARDGVIFARGHAIPAGSDVSGMTILDVTPTILARFGMPVADDMDGQVADFMQLQQKPAIATYDTFEIERLAGEESGSEEAIMEQLKLLGYIE